MSEGILAQLGGSDDSLYLDILKEYLDDRTLIINENITDDVVENYVLRILKWNKEDNDLGIPKENRKPIKIYINTEGGDALSGFNFVDVIMASTTPIIGIGLGLVASAGFYIYLACHTRYCFPHSVLLMHDGSIVVQNSTNKAKQTMKFFDNMEARTKKFVLSRCSLTEEEYDSHYDQEYYMYADEEGKSLNIVHKIIGTDITLEDIL